MRKKRYYWMVIVHNASGYGTTRAEALANACKNAGRPADSDGWYFIFRRGLLKDELPGNCMTHPASWADSGAINPTRYARLLGSNLLWRLMNRLRRKRGN